MGTAQVLDFDQLLAPVAGERATGVNLSDDVHPDEEYDALRRMRNEFRAIERRMETADADEVAREKLSRPSWAPLIERASKVIAEKSKDMEVAAWLIEGLVREHGFAGLRMGFGSRASWPRNSG